MAPTNYDMAHECIGTAEKAGTLQLAHIEAMAAQTYATLALVDELRAQRHDVRDTVADEVSDAMIDMNRPADLYVKYGGTK